MLQTHNSLYMNSLIWILALNSILGQQPKHKKTIHTDVNHEFKITLVCQCGTGFSWKLSDSSFNKNIQFLKQDFAPDKDSRPGSDGTQLFFFKAVKKGVASVRFVYVRPFIKEIPPNAKKESFQVIIN